jgi:CHAT domain-containing protein/tetratricopeptide (TPR) repeat protein
LVILSFFVNAQGWDSLNHEGLQLYRHGQYDAAIAKLIQALRVSEDESGKVSTAYATSLTNLAFAYKGMGNYPEAGRLFSLAVKIADQQKPDSHIDRIEARANLANLFLEKGQYDSSEFYLLEGLQMIQLAPEKNPSYYRESLHAFNVSFVSLQNSIASLKRRKGQTGEAIGILESLISFLKEVYPEQYDSLSEYRTLLSNLGNYHMELGNLDRSRQLNVEYTRLVRDHPADPIVYLYALQNMGNIFRLLDQPDSAIGCWSKALDYINQDFYLGSELHLSILNNMGELYSSLEEYDKAIAVLLKAREINESRGGTIPNLYQTTLFNLAVTYQWSNRYAAADTVYDKLIHHLLDEVQYNFTYLTENEKISFYRTQLEILESYLFFALTISGTIPLQETDTPYINPDITQQLYNLQILTKGIILNASHKMKSRILEGKDESLKIDYQLWERQKNELATLIRANHPSPPQIALLESSIENLEIQLSRKSAPFKRGFVMEAVTWKDIQHQLKPGEAAIEMVRFVGGLIYGAMIITPETVERPALVIVKSTEKRYLEKEYFRHYANSIAYKLIDTLSYQVYWKPIFESVKKLVGPDLEIKRIFFSPDGIYNQINLNALYDVQAGQYVIDQVEIHQLTNTKNLQREQATEAKSKSKKAVLFGRPAFTLEGSVEVGLFSDLIGTETEVTGIADLLAKRKWKTDVYKGRDATEANVKQFHSADVLHLATHGFFDRPATEGATSSLIRILLNSGIALAGANQSTALEDEDGILTAYECLNLNLDETRLVVLSACETGLGEFYPGEGVYGLRLALNSAGAENIMMSLWKVDDDATQKLMTLFYQEWLDKPNDMRASFRKAQQELRKVRPEPYYWGAFVLSGN